MCTSFSSLVYSPLSLWPHPAPSYCLVVSSDELLGYDLSLHVTPGSKLSGRSPYWEIRVVLSERPLPASEAHMWIF